MKISNEYLTLLKNSRAQLQAAQINHQFVMQNLIAEYKLTSTDSLNFETGEITRTKDSPQNNGARASKKKGLPV